MRSASITRAWRAVPGFTLLLAGLLAAGCGATSAAGASTPTPTPTMPPTVTPTTTPSPAPSPAASLTPTPLCGSLPQFASATRAGDLRLTNQNGFGGFSWWAAAGGQLPDATPLKPLQAQYGSSTSGLLVPADPATNPNLQEGPAGDGGYEIDICNASATQTHIIQGVTARLTAFASYSGSLQEWKGGCEGAPFDASTRQSLGVGCGGGPYWACEYAHASFPSAAGVGATVSAKQTGSARDNGGVGDCPPVGSLPVALAPGVALSFNLGVTAPTAPGTYTFAFGFAVDGAAPTYVAVRPTLLAPVAHMWSGDACTAAMQAQIPTTKSSTYYICPE